MDKNKHSSTKPVYTSKAQQAFLECTSICTRMQKLVRQGKREEITNDVINHFKIAKRYHFNKLAREFASFLQYYYCNVNRDEKLGVKYTNLALFYNELNFIENIVSIKFVKMSSVLNQTKRPSAELIEELKVMCADMKLYLKHDSAKVWAYAYTLFNALAYFQKNFDVIISQSKEVIKYLNNRGGERTAHFYKDLTIAYILIGKYINAEIAIGNAINIINKGTYSWSVFIYYRLIIELHKKNYQEAYNIYREAEEKRYIKKETNKVIYETWYYVKAYIKFLIMAGKIKAESHQFKIGHFLNSIIVFNKDKSGHKINTLILKIILRLDSEKGKATVLKERDAIKKYSEENFEKGTRARVFFRMLLHIVPGDFNAEKVKQRVAKNVAPLPAQPGYDPDLEIIPYEHLWELVLEMLD